MYLKSKMINKMKILFFAVVWYLCFSIAKGQSSKVDDATDTESTRKYALEKLLPTAYCGLQHYDDFVHDDNEPQVSLYEFPWLLDVESQANSPVGGKNIVCSGVLISNNYGLTLRECILSGNESTSTKANLGGYEWRKNVSCVETRFGADCNDPLQQIDVENWVHINNSNLVLFRLKKKVRYSDFIRPICLPTGDVTSPKLNDTLQTTGWGSAGGDELVKKRTAVRITDETKCNVLSTQPYGRNAVCVEVLEDITNTCAVVQGGPSMHKFSHRWFVHGIIGEINCNLGIYRIELITPEVVNFILDNLKR